MKQIFLPIAILTLLLIMSCNNPSQPISESITESAAEIETAEEDLPAEAIAPVSSYFDFKKNGFLAVPLNENDSMLRVFFPEIDTSKSCQTNSQATLDIGKSEVLYLSVAVLDTNKKTDKITVTKYSDSESIPESYKSYDVCNLQFSGGINILKYDHGKGNIDPVVHGEDNVRDSKIDAALGVNLRYEDMYITLKAQDANPNALKVIVYVDSTLNISSGCIINSDKGSLYKLSNCSINDGKGFSSTCHLK